VEGRFYKVERKIPGLLQPSYPWACQRTENNKNMKPVTIISLVSVGYVFISLLSIGLLFSCSKEDQKDLTAANLQIWQLVKMTGSMSNSETTGKDMAWQEYYIFNADSTFLKSREQDGQVKEAKGTYSYSTLADEKNILLTFNSGFELKASCLSGPPQEKLRIVSTTKMLGTWNHCDGPGLEYQLHQAIVD
jgi:hypothetical protein